MERVETKHVDTLVIGGGVSGMSFAYQAANAGRATLVLERAEQIGGCVHSHRTDDGFWFELGAHTAYNSYGGFLEMIEGCGLMSKLGPRQKAPFRLYEGGRLRSIASALSFFELARSAPKAFFLRKDGRTVREFFGGLAGMRNYDRVLGAFLSAVPSQRADDFPATMLFKKRPRRKDVLRSYAIDGGLQTVLEGVAAHANVQVRTGVSVRALAPTDHGMTVTCADGEVLTADTVALAVPPDIAAKLVATAYPELAAALARIAVTQIETVGVVVEASGLSLERVAGIVPLNDVFHSAVSRDPVPHPRYRGFAFHFRPGTPDADKEPRIADVLGVDVADFVHVVRYGMQLPSPRMGHPAIVADIDRAIANGRLCVTGNYFAGMAIEDCVERSKAEFARVRETH